MTHGDHTDPASSQANDVTGDGSITSFALGDDGTWPNNARYPLVVYRRAVAMDNDEPAQLLEDRFHDQRWSGVWRNGIFGYHHFHSTAHEVLGIATGTARVQFGGDSGPVLDLAPGDVVVVPAGVAHRRIRGSDDLVVVGAYPNNQIWDVMTGEADERERALEHIPRVEPPVTDPVLGESGPLLDIWNLR